MKIEKKFLKGIYFSMIFYIIGLSFSAIFWNIGAGPCSPGLGTLIAIVFFVIGLLLGITFLFFKKPFYRSASITFLILTIISLLIFKITLYFL